MDSSVSAVPSPPLSIFEEDWSVPRVENASTRSRWDYLLSRVESNIWDTAAWRKLIDLSRSLPLSLCRPTYRHCLYVFPNYGYLVGLWGVRELAEGTEDEARRLLQENFGKTFDVNFWLFYVRFIRVTVYNPAKNAYLSARESLDPSVTSSLPSLQQAYHQARASMVDVFEASLTHLSSSFHLGEIWLAYVEYLQTEFPSDSSNDGHAARDMRRRVFTRAVQQPHKHVARLWADYCTFEKTISVDLAAKLLAELDPRFQTADRIAKKREALWDSIDCSFIAGLPPTDKDFQQAREFSSDQFPGEIEADLVKIRAALSTETRGWRSLLAHELRNDAQASTNDFVEYVKGLYQICVSVMRYSPDFFVDFAEFALKARKLTTSSASTGVSTVNTANPSTGGSGGSANSVPPTDDVLAPFLKAISVLPTSVTLVCAASDYLESERDFKQAASVYWDLIARLEKLALQGKTTIATPPAYLSIIPPVPGSSEATEYKINWLQYLSHIDSTYSGLSEAEKVPSILFACPTDWTSAAVAVSSVYIILERVVRRMSGIDAAREVSTRARRSPFCSALVYLCSAQQEVLQNHQLDVARKIAFKGIAKYPLFVPVLLAFLDLFCRFDEHKNVLHLYKSILSQLPPSGTRPVHDRFLQYCLTEARFPPPANELEEFETQRNKTFPSLLGASGARILSRKLHRTAVFGAHPGTRVDFEFFRKYPYDRFAVLEGSPPQTGTISNTSTSSSSNTVSGMTGNASSQMSTSPTSSLTNHSIHDWISGIQGLPYDASVIAGRDPIESYRFRSPLNYLTLVSGSTPDPTLAEGFYLQGGDTLPGTAWPLTSPPLGRSLADYTAILKENSLSKELIGRDAEKEREKDGRGLHSNMNTTGSNASGSSDYLRIPPFLQALMERLPAYDSKLKIESIPPVDSILEELLSFKDGPGLPAVERSRKRIRTD